MIFIAHRRNTLEELNTTPVEYGIEVDIRSRGENSSSTMMRWFRAEISSGSRRTDTADLECQEEGLEARLLP